MKFFKLNYLFAVLLLVGMFGCADDEPTIQEIDISDGGAVSEALEFENVTAVVQDGQLPESSTDADAPKLTDEGSKVTSISGSAFVLEIGEETGADVKGMYLQVDGSESYFDISLESTSTGGRLAGRTEKRKRIFGNSARVAEYITYLLINLPENMASGSFCVTFSVYDTEDKISNYINVCVEVLRPSGEGSNFLTANTWEMLYSYYRDEYDGIVNEDWDTAGVTDISINTFTQYCDDQTSKKMEEIYENRIDHLYVTFFSDGMLSMEEKYYEKYADYESTTCDGVVYKEFNLIFKGEGKWSYNRTKKELTIAVVYEEEGEESEVEISQFDVEELNNGGIRLYYEEMYDNGNFINEIYFQAKK